MVYTLPCLTKPIHISHILPILQIGGGKMILFGGERDGGGALDDLWVLKGLGTEAMRSVFS